MVEILTNKLSQISHYIIECTRAYFDNRKSMEYWSLIHKHMYIYQYINNHVWLSVYQFPGFNITFVKGILDTFDSY